jgi:hypothetical protein
VPLHTNAASAAAREAFIQVVSIALLVDPCSRLPAREAPHPNEPSRRFVLKEEWSRLGDEGIPEAARLKQVAQLLEGMKASGVIRDYALFGAVAQMRYTEPMATLDVDVLTLLAEDSAAVLDPLSPIYNYCRERGYLAEGEAIRVGSWPVQFIPVFSPLTEEAVRTASSEAIEGVPLQVVGAEYLAVIALSVGRPKDYARILALLEAGAVGKETIQSLAQRHGLAVAWQAFQRRFLDD